MNKRKIINDPIYGFITIPYDIIFDLIEHPYFQRLRRIKQLGLTHYVYPGALHTRFHHALGAMHLMQQAIKTLRGKSIEITGEEAKAVTIAILLHDIGHGPFSHALEQKIVKVHHEEISLLFMEELNEEFDGKLDLAIKIFKGDYYKKFLHQLVSSQLDMDRMDYLNRDSYFTGVSEGVIGYDRIIKMLNVRNDEIVIEYKGIYSIEKFLIARRIMYWQVYLHKTALSAEQMLIKVFERVKTLASQKVDLPISDALRFFVYNNINSKQFRTNRKELLRQFALLDDVDIISALKKFTQNNDFILKKMSTGILNRQLFRVEIKNNAFNCDYIESIRHKVKKQLHLTNEQVLSDLIIIGTESNRAYSTKKDEIKMLMKDNSIKLLLDASDHIIDSDILIKHYICYPK
jgi:HD superfamily phosphohydrolase